MPSSDSSKFVIFRFEPTLMQTQPANSMTVQRHRIFTTYLAIKVHRAESVSKKVVHGSLHPKTYLLP